MVSLVFQRPSGCPEASNLGGPSPPGPSRRVQRPLQLGERHSLSKISSQTGVIKD